MVHSNGLILEANERTTAGCEWIELIAVLKRDDGLVCRFYVPNGRSFCVTVTPADLQTFAAFQRRVASELGFWPRHSSEQERTARLQRDDWALAVEVAWRAGS